MSPCTLYKIGIMGLYKPRIDIARQPLRLCARDQCLPCACPPIARLGTIPRSMGSIQLPNIGIYIAR